MKYPEFITKVENARLTAGRPLTYAEKILYSHLAVKPVKPLVRGKDYAELCPDRVAMQDATAQMALLQFMHAGMEKTAVPASVHCDHLITAECGADKDLAAAKRINREVYDFLSSVSLKYGIECWKPGAGIIHQLILENYAFPAGLLIGTDSHSPNAGGAGMLGVGVGGADAVDVMAGMTWELKWPGLIGVKLTGRLKGWASPKDIILKLLGILTVKGGTGSIIEYFGEGASSISATGKATICNMGAELGATSSIFPYDEKIGDYLKATGRKDIDAGSYINELCCDPDVRLNPEKYFDRVIEINLDELEPHLNGPFTPDLAVPVSAMKDVSKGKGFTDVISAGLIGSCTNSSYEDLDRAGSIARQALKHGIKPGSKLYLSPGSEKVRATLEKNGILKIFEKLGVTILANACGPCIGMWNRTDMPMGEQNTIITSFNRNFSKRADGNPNTMAFVASPEMVMALSLGGRLSFNPLTDKLTGKKGEEFKLAPPSGKEIPDAFYEGPGGNGIIENKKSRVVNIVIPEKSDRLQLLRRFDPWNGKDIINAPVLIKIKGKCTTDQISMAGVWLKYRGHLDNISNNLLSGAVNAYNGKTGMTLNEVTGEEGAVPAVAREYKKEGVSWIVIGDENYGEGSSREHAAMEVRYLGGKAVIVKSFARIHETNLKKQGVLALTFSNPADYDKIREGDMADILGLGTFSPDKPLSMIIQHKKGGREEIILTHTYNDLQIKWFKAGSALNLIAGSAGK
jgi:aconitate hydratase